MKNKHAPFVLLAISIIGLFSLTLFPAMADNAFSGQHSDALNQDGTPASDSDEFPANSLAVNTSASGSADESNDDPWDEEEDEKTVVVADPLSVFNRVMFTFNDRLYFWLLKPVSKGYRAIAPYPVRMGIKNFFSNIGAPIRIASCLLQGKGHSAMAEYSKFIINSTAGVGGFGNPAKKYPQLNPGEEDMGQTLGFYGVGNGIYLVWPFLGPSTLRDTIGMAADQFFLAPVAYVEPMEAGLGIKAWETINSTSLKIGDYESLKDASIKPYEAFRNAYIQYRGKRVSD
jgi:phospholipid-binding lipoprotein MlaA